MTSNAAYSPARRAATDVGGLLAHALSGVGTAIAQLSPKLRDAFVLRYVEELPYDEIATVLAQPVGTVKANAHRGRAFVRMHLETDR